MKKPTFDWKVDIRDETTYNRLVEMGLAFEFYPSMPLTWRMCLEELKELNKEEE